MRNGADRRPMPSPDAHALPVSVLHAVVAAGLALLADWMSRRAARRHRRQLDDLSDWILEDIGLSRASLDGGDRPCRQP